jgi:hypothetical protein
MKQPYLFYVGKKIFDTTLCMEMKYTLTFDGHPSPKIGRPKEGEGFANCT